MSDFKLPPTKKGGASAPPPPADAEVPRYELTEDAFIAPHLVRRGSIISSRNYPPGFHTKPLNQAARDKLEAWYEQSKKVAAHLDENGNIVPEKTYYHNRQYKPFALGEAPEAVEFELLEGPPADLPGQMDLGTAQFARPAENASQAPGPLMPVGRKSQWYEPMNTEALGGSTADSPVPSGTDTEDGVHIEASAPVPPPKDRVQGN